MACTYYRTRDWPANTATALAVYIQHSRPARLSGAASEFLSEKAQLVGAFAGLKNQLCPSAIPAVHHVLYYYILLADGLCTYILYNMILLFRRYTAIIERCIYTYHIYRYLCVCNTCSAVYIVRYIHT